MPISNVLSVNDIMASCPEKLLRYVPWLLNGLEARKKARALGVHPDNMPPLPILAIKGWRFSGKSQFGVRFQVGAILDGWAQSGMIAAITSDGAKDTMQLLDKV